MADGKTTRLPYSPRLLHRVEAPILCAHAASGLPADRRARLVQHLAVCALGARRRPSQTPTRGHRRWGSRTTVSVRPDDRDPASQPPGVRHAADHPTAMFLSVKTLLAKPDGVRRVHWAR